MTSNLDDLNKDTAAKPQEVSVEHKEEDASPAHRRLEHDAMKAAKRAGKRESEEERGEFTNIGTF